MSAFSFGGTGADRANAVVADANGNIYVWGQYMGTADFDPGAGSTTFDSINGGNDTYLAKYDATGALQWAISMGSAGGDVAYGMALTSTGVVVTGLAWDTFALDPLGGSLETASGGFVAAYDDQGALDWSWSALGTVPKDVAVHPSGDVFVTGSFFGSIDFGPTTLNAMTNDPFVMMINPTTGACTWVTQFSSSFPDEGVAIAASNTSNTVYVAGGYGSDLTLPGGTVLTNAGGSDLFVVALDSQNGSVTWSHSIGSNNSDTAIDIAVTDFRVYVLGSTQGTVTLGAGGPDVTNTSFLMPIHPNGTPMTGTALGEGGIVSGYALTTDSAGNAIVAGTFSGTVDFNPGTGQATFLSNALYYDGFVSVFDIWSQYQGGGVFGGTGYDDGYAVAWRNGNLYLGGRFTSSGDFDPTGGVATLASSGGFDYDAFVTNVPFDFAGPVVTGMTIPADGTYGDGDKLTFTVTFDEIVTVTGTPRLAIDIGGDTVYVQYTGGSGGDTLTFEYEIQAGQQDGDGLTYASAYIDLAGGTIKDEAGNNALLTLNGADLLDNVLVDGGPPPPNPTVTAVTGPASGAYRLGEVLEFQVTFNQDIDVSGSPQLSIGLDGSTVLADFVEVNGDTVTFSYEVQEGDIDTDGPTPVGITLNGGTITGTNNGLAANTTLVNVADMFQVEVDGVIPTAIGLTASATTLGVGDSALLLLEFDEWVNCVGTPVLYLDVGGQTVQATYNAASSTNTAVAFEFTAGAGEDDGDGITVTGASGVIRDAAGNVADLSTLDFDTDILVDTTAPFVSASTPANGATGVAVGSNITLTFSEAVTAVAGTIGLYDSDGMLIESFDVATQGIPVNGVVTLDPTDPLLPGTGYYLTISDQAYADAVQNLSAEVTDGALAFTTAAASGNTGGGGSGNPLVGTPGTDALNGTAANDLILGMEDGDECFGGGGDDLIYGNEGDDGLSGGSGDDTIYGGQDADRMTGGDDNDRLWGNRGADTAYGNTGDDFLWGNQEDDWLHGGQGNDWLHGGQGDDWLHGGLGDDTLCGGLGDDTMIGGDGADLFRFNGGTDVITDFDGQAGDRVQVIEDWSWQTVEMDGSTVLLFDDGSSLTLTGVALDQWDDGWAVAA